MTPQAFSYPTVGPNGMIYVPPYGLNESLNYMIVVDPETYAIKKIKLEVTNCKEKWQRGTVVGSKIFWLPYNEQSILVLDTNTHEISYIDTVQGTGKWIYPHLHNDKIIALPYGEHESFNLCIIVDTKDNTADFINIDTPVKDTKLWHTTQILGDTIFGMPRGEEHDSFFPYGIRFNCNTLTYELEDFTGQFKEYDLDRTANKKYTTLAKANNKLYAPPYSESKDFDLLAIYNNSWQFIKTNITATSRKYYSHTVAKNKKVYFPPAGHDEDWSEMLIIDSIHDTWQTKDLHIGKESKKYFAGIENSKGKIYYIPRGGCVCEPEETWKSQGDLAEILVVDTADDSCYTINVSEYFTDNTTIEKYNQCVIINDIIYAFPYGESDSFQTVLIFDTIKEKVIKTLDLNEL